MIKALLLSPPFALLIILFFFILLSAYLSRFAFKNKKDHTESKKAYSCGEEFSGHMIQPDYSQFFPFAFFFTILHVVALVIATVPAEAMKVSAIAVLYIIGAILGLFILLRK